MLRSIGAMRRDPLAFLAQMRADYGPVVQFPIPSPPTYLVSDVDAVRRVLVTGARAYGKRTLQYTSLSLVTGEGLLTADTEAWRPQRALVQPAFHRAGLDLVAEHVRGAVDRLILGWTALDGQVVDVDSAMMHTALEVVGNSLFGSDLSASSARLAEATVAALDVVVKKARTPWAAPAWVPTPNNLVLARAVSTLNSAVSAILTERAANPLPEGAPPRDMLDLLLASHADDGTALSRRQVRDQVVTFIVAGHETVASALTWAWQLLATHPDVRDRVRAEVDDVCGDRAVTPTAVHSGGAGRGAAPVSAGVARDTSGARGRHAPRPGAWACRDRGGGVDHREPVDRASRSVGVAGPGRVRPDEIHRRRGRAASRYRRDAGVPALRRRTSVVHREGHGAARGRARAGLAGVAGRPRARGPTASGGSTGDDEARRRPADASAGTPLTSARWSRR